MRKVEKRRGKEGKEGAVVKVKDIEREEGEGRGAVVGNQNKRQKETEVPKCNGCMCVCTGEWRVPSGGGCFQPPESQIRLS